MREPARKRSIASEVAGRVSKPLLSLLVPIDLSPISDRVLARVARLPLASEATITVLHVVPAGLTVREQQKAVREAKEALRAEVSHLAKSLATGVSVLPVVAVGSPATEIAARAEAASAELIIMGRCGRRPVRDAFLGSTAERVVRRARTPVLVVQLPARSAYTRLALAVDLDEAAQGALEMLLRLVQRPRPFVTLIHAFLDLYRGMIYSDLSSEEVEQRQRVLQRHASEQLMTLLADSLVRAKVPAAYAPVWDSHVRYGSPRTIIKKVVKKAEPELLVLGSHGRSGLAHLFLGTVAGDVLRDVDCDVLVVPPRRSRR